MNNIIIIQIDYGNDIGIRYTIVDTSKTGKEFVIKEFKKHKDAINYLNKLSNKNDKKNKKEGK